MKRTFFERITGTISAKRNLPPFEDENEETDALDDHGQSFTPWSDATEEESEGELSVDVYQTNEAIMVQAMVAGVASEDLSLSVTREMITIKGRREAPKNIPREDYYYQELYWGAFSRTILLPAEIDTEEVEATEKHGLLTIKLPKIDKGRTQTVKIKSL